MKTIQIPTNKNPFVVVINNTVYVYKAGDTVEVPDEVAEVIENLVGLTPKPNYKKSDFEYLTGVIDRNITDIDVPREVKKIGTYSLAYCLQLSDVTLNEGLEDIDASAFSRDTAIKSIEIPSSVTTISANAFYACTGLKKVVFKGTPKTINSTAFADCSALKDIYVSWKEGTVAGAPWGAENATVHYKV